jgi:hypothetical protein
LALFIHGARDNPNPVIGIQRVEGRGVVGDKRLGVTLCLNRSSLSVNYRGLAIRLRPEGTRYRGVLGQQNYLQGRIYPMAMLRLELKAAALSVSARQNCLEKMAKNLFTLRLPAEEFGLPFQLRHGEN